VKKLSSELIIEIARLICAFEMIARNEQKTSSMKSCYVSFDETVIHDKNYNKNMLGKFFYIGISVSCTTIWLM